MIAMDDVQAARVLLGADGPTHEKVADLPGADLCIHALAGSGENIADLEARHPTWGDASSANDPWWSHPYRHHLFTQRTTNAGMDDPYCECGNGKGHIIHFLCVKSERL